MSKQIVNLPNIDGLVLAHKNAHFEMKQKGFHDLKVHGRPHVVIINGRLYHVMTFSNGVSQ